MEGTSEPVLGGSALEPPAGRSKLRWILMAVAGGLIAAALFLPIPGDTGLLRDIQNIGHAPAFVVITLLVEGVLSLLPWRVGAIERYALRISAVAVLAVATEAAQIPLSRDADWGDIFMNLAGGAIGIALVAAFDRALTRRLRLGAGAVATLGGLGIAFSALTVLEAHFRKLSAFPLIVSGSTCAQVELLVPQSSQIECDSLPPQWAHVEGERGARVVLMTGQWPGFAIDEPVADWSGYRELVLDLVNPGSTPLDLVIRVHDRDHDFEASDRFNRAFRLPAESRTAVRIDLDEVREAPMGRELDLRRVRGVVVYLPDDVDRRAGEVLYVQRIGLE
jgi:hypothetical protein